MFLQVNHIFFHISENSDEDYYIIHIHCIQYILHKKYIEIFLTALILQGCTGKRCPFSLFFHCILVNNYTCILHIILLFLYFAFYFHDLSYTENANYKYKKCIYYQIIDA